MKYKSLGFSLIEISVVLSLLGAAMVLIWEIVKNNTVAQNTIENATLVGRADQALQGFIMAKFRLPCPDTDGDGREDCSGSQHTGKLPYLTLGIADENVGQINYDVMRNLGESGRTDVEKAQDKVAYSVSLTQVSDAWWPTLAHIRTKSSDQSIAANVRAGTPLPDSFDYNHAEIPRTQAVPLGVVNQLDFCYKLRRAIVVLTEADEPGQTLPPGFDAPVYSLQYPASDARETSRAMTPYVLWNQLGCPEVMASAGQTLPNVALAATMLYRSIYDMTEVQRLSVQMDWFGANGAWWGDVIAAAGGLASVPAERAGSLASCINEILDVQIQHQYVHVPGTQVFQDSAIAADPSIKNCELWSRATKLLTMTQLTRMANNFNIFISSVMTSTIQTWRLDYLEALAPRVRMFADELIQHAVYTDALGMPIAVSYSGGGGQQ